MKQLQSSALSPSSRVSREVTVVLDFTEASPVVLELSYLCYQASWRAAYDMRVDNAGADGENASLTYYGVVKQSTGESWDHVPLSLSTASPAQGGAPPMPPTRSAQWKKKTPFMAYGTRRGSGGPRFRSGLHMRANMALPMQAAMDEPLERRLSISAMELEDHEEDDPLGKGGGGIELKGAAKATSKVKETAGSTLFRVARPATIASDNKEHKVTINLLNCSPSFRYFCTPSLEERVYLQAKAKNSSPYPLLATEEGVAVFMDGSFVTRTPLKVPLLCPLYLFQDSDCNRA